MDETLDYIKAELQTLGTAFGETRKARMDAVRYYFLMLGAVPVVLGLVLNEQLLGMVQDKQDKPILVLYSGCGAFVVASIAGTLIMLQVLGLRLEEILYARAINALRHYVVKRYADSSSPPLETAFALPMSDMSPRFLENWDRPARFILYLILLVNLCLVYGAFVTLNAAGTEGVNPSAFLLPWWGWLVVLAYAALEVVLVYWFPHRRESQWRSVTDEGATIDNW